MAQSTTLAACELKLIIRPTAPGPHENYSDHTAQSTNHNDFQTISIGTFKKQSATVHLTQVKLSLG